MKKRLTKFFVNILLGVVPFSSLRKKLRSGIMHRFDKSNKLIIVHPDGSRTEKYMLKGLNINFAGQNSSLVIHEPVEFSNCQFCIGKNSHVEIGSNSYINTLSINAMNFSDVSIGRGFSCISCNIENIDEAGIKISIGNNCMFSHHVEIRASDGHAIYELGTGKAINTPDKGVYIGNNVWLGMHVKVLKNTNIPDNTIVGAGSMVTKSFTEEHTIIAGSPAKVIKKGVNWCRENTDALKELGVANI